jgi:hypothetical protein
LELLFCYFEFFSCFRAFFIAFPNDSDSGKRKFVEIIGEIREIPAKYNRALATRRLAILSRPATPTSLE